MTTLGNNYLAFQSAVSLGSFMRFLPLFAAIFAITPLAIDMYLPALTRLVADFDAPIEWVQNSLSIYLAGYAFGMFLFGPLADKVGRRPLVIGGLAGFVLFSVCLSLAESIEVFILFRFLQALAGGAATVVIPGAIRHLFGKHTAKGLSYVSMIMMIAPMIAPALGSYILQFGDWRLIFLNLAGYAGVILLIAALFFPKLEVRSSTGLSELSFIASYRKVVANKRVQPLLAITMLASLVFFTYITSVSFLLMTVFGLDEKQFSWTFALNVLAMIAASFINARLVPRLGSRKILRVAALIALCFGGLFLGFIVIGAQPNMVIVALIPMIASLMAITANADALILRQFSQQTGTATAVIGSLRFGSGAMAGPLLGIIYDESALPIAILVVVALFVLNSCLFFVAPKRKRLVAAKLGKC